MDEISQIINLYLNTYVTGDLMGILILFDLK